MNKGTKITSCSKTNVFKLIAFHIYRNGRKCKSKISFFIKGSVKKLKPKKKIKFKKSRKFFTLLVKSKQWCLRFDGSQRKFNSNSVILLKKNSNIWTKYLKGSTFLEINRKKYLTFFKRIF